MDKMLHLDEGFQIVDLRLTAIVTQLFKPGTPEADAEGDLPTFTGIARFATLNDGLSWLSENGFEKIRDYGGYGKEYVRECNPDLLFEIGWHREPISLSEEEAQKDISPRSDTTAPELGPYKVFDKKRLAYHLIEIVYRKNGQKCFVPARTIGRLPSREAAERWLRENGYLDCGPDPDLWSRSPDSEVVVAMRWEPLIVPDQVYEQEIVLPSDSEQCIYHE